jgi:glucose/arabinose dehydrogenase
VGGVNSDLLLPSSKRGVKMGKSVEMFATIALALLASIATLLVLPVVPAKGAASVPAGFTDSEVVSGLTNPTDMEFAPDGRLFVTEQAGTVRIVRPEGTLATFLDISTKVDSTGERGLLGLAFDPDFSTNHFVYLHYTREATATTSVHNRVVRVTASGDSAVAGSERLIFRLNNLSSATNHNGGAIHFGEGGKLYVAVGDNANGDNAQSLGTLKGKMLRINKNGTIPAGNPFYSTASGNNRAIWALGLRNPFKFAVKPNTGTIFINDVGERAWEEINRGASGANYGWNLCEGNHDNPSKPGSVNCSAAPYSAPVHEYSHGSTEITGCSITGGAFYNPNNVQFPSAYSGDYFFADFCSGWIRILEPIPGGGFAARGFATGIARPVDLEVSEAGELYYLARGSTGTPRSVGKIWYSGT